MQTDLMSPSWQNALEYLNKWQLALMVLLSLTLQAMLIFLGSRRKYTAGTRIKLGILIRFLVWAAYLSADEISMTALGNLFRSLGDNSENSGNHHGLQVIWAPLLLLHLGGPDTITAYSLEDNELWLRHLFRLAVQVGTIGYVFMKSWGMNSILFLCIPLFVGGIIKYAERVLALKSASRANIHDSLSPRDDKVRKELQPHFEQYMHSSDGAQSSQEQVARRIRACIFKDERISEDAKLLCEAYFTFLMLAELFTNTALFPYEVNGMLLMASTLPTKDMIKVVETELGFMYDILFTKAIIIYSKLGTILRFNTLSCSIGALVAFSLIDKKQYEIGDMVVSYVLLAGAVVLEVYAVLVLIYSDWTKLWLIKQRNLPLAYKFYQVVSRGKDKKKWSRSMSQYSILGLCINETKSTLPQKLGVDELLRKYIYRTYAEVDENLIERIFDRLKAKHSDIDLTGKAFIRCDEEFRATIEKGTLDQTILLWHIATEVCYYIDEPDVQALSTNDAEISRKYSKCLSQYILYLLVQCPLMLPKGLADVNFKLTSDDIKQLMVTENIAANKNNVAQLLYKKGNKPRMVNEDPPVYDPDTEIEHREHVYPMYDGCMLAKRLRLRHPEKLWDILSDVWMEILTYCARQSDWREHAQQLMRGGELLTHVCVFMAHIGMNEQSMFHVKHSASV